MLFQDKILARLCMVRDSEKFPLFIGGRSDISFFMRWITVFRNTDELDGILAHNLQTSRDGVPHEVSLEVTYESLEINRGRNTREKGQKP